MNVLFAKYRKTFGSIMTLFFLVALVCAANAQDDSRLTVKRGAQVIHLVKHDISPALRAIPPAPFAAGVKRIHHVKPLPGRAFDSTRPVAGELDANLQLSNGPLAMPTPASNFAGISDGMAGFNVASAPPDTNGDIGPTHYVQTVNTSMAVYSKTGTLLWGPSPISTLWSGFGGGCQTNNDGDPTVTYDQNNDRWVIAQFSVSTTPYLECVAVSQTGDPTGSYYRYSYAFGSSMNDYPKVGMWGGDYYITYNMFLNAQSFQGGKVCAHQGSKLRTGQANTMQCFDETDGGLLAADMDGSAQPPAGAPQYVISFGTNTLNVWKMKIDWSNSSLSIFTGPTTVSVNSFSIASSVPQPGTTVKLDALSDRLMNRLAYRNRGGTESFVVTHSVSASLIAAVRWYELRTSNSSTTTPTLYQQGTYSPDTNHRWMGSVAMDKDGNIAAGYSVSSSSLKPSIRFAGRLATDPLGQFSQGETTLIAGGGSQTGGLTRWGDYSSMNIDPTDDCTFWFTTEYLTADGSFNWSTRIGSFKFSTCGGGTGDTTAPTTSITAPSAGATLSGNATVSASASDNIGVTNVEFYAGATLIGSDSTSPYSITWNTTTIGNGSYTLTSKAYDAAGNVGTSAGVGVTVANAGQAAYNATLKAPSCSSVGTFCDSGTLLDSRGTLSPAEPNQPNTINNSCADGTSGTYHSDESLDKLRVATTDGSNFASGKTVTVTATVWCWGTADSLDLYYTANANSPSWTLIGSQACAASGQAVAMTANYTLPSGSLQAIRGNYRYQGSAGFCTTGSYDDHDDLIFAVGSTADTTAPTTSITAPTAGSTVSGTITVSANASDNVGVTKVEFYAGTTLIGTDTTSPYSVSWNTTTVANGSVTLTSKAYDAANNVGTSAGVGVTVNNTTPDTTAPTTSITSPTAGSTVSGTITVNANASDNVGVTKVEFYAGTTLIGTDTTSPYSISWNTTTVANGSVTLTSKAYDAANNVGTSAGVGVTVNNTTPDTTAPTTSITSPVAGSTVSGTITVSANASDDVGVTKVEFYAGASLIGSDTTSPYSISWNTTTVVNGSYTLTSKAYDAATNVGTSTGVGVTVNNSVTCGSSSQLLGNPGFESGSTTWTKYSSTGNTSGIITNSTSRPARTGAWYAWLNGYGTSSTQYIYQQVVVPSNACSAQLALWLRIDTAETTTSIAYDTVKVQVRQKNTDGTWGGWSTKATYSNLNANSTYVQKTFDLIAYKGKTIQVRFYGKEDTSLQTSFVIDDTAVNITQ